MSRSEVWLCIMRLHQPFFFVVALLLLDLALDEDSTEASSLDSVSEKSGALLENSAIIRNLTREHACRAILVEINRVEPLPSLRAWITAHCHLAHGRKSICCEQIALYLTGIVTGP